MLQGSREYLRGRWAEIVWMAMLGHWGWSTIATCDYSGADGGFAPMSHGAIEMVLPDLDGAKLGHRAFLESKLKAHSFEWRKTRQWQHGIEVRSLAHYKRAEKTYGSVVVLGIIEEDTGHMRANTLRGLGTPRISKNERYPIANWGRNQFRFISELSPKNLHRLIYSDSDEVRSPPLKITPDMLRALVDFLRPSQPELGLLHYDILTQRGAIDD